MFNSISQNVSAEIIEKKSKFIANLFYVETKEEAEDIIKTINKKYFDARHICYAYRIMSNTGIIEKFSDDGEPSGTAGAPLLGIISKKELANILIVVTRYFGGILLGTGGLVKAYSLSLTLALEKAEIISRNIAKLYKIEIPYTDLNKFRYFANNNDIKVIKEEFLTDIELQIALEDEKKLDNILKKDINIKKKEFIKEIYI